ncbi:MAG: NAD(P)H-hydrate dehydratase [Burkholderiaceae bacterium]
MQARLPAQALMRRAGLSVARLALALAPHAERIWIACGPGNNGGDGFEAAALLQQAGKQVHVTALGDATARPADAAGALQRAQAAGVRVNPGLDGGAAAASGLAIDALFGLGHRAASGDTFASDIVDALRVFNGRPTPRLAIDLPSGLDAERGTCADVAAQATDTLSLLTLKPGLFTAQGRDHAGRVWFDDLGAEAAGTNPFAHADSASAFLAGGAGAARLCHAPRRHQQHKGSFGDVLVVGGASGMAGAAMLAARAAVRAGAGRVYACLLDPEAPSLDTAWPELMLRRDHWRSPNVLATSTVVCGCGGGQAIAAVLPALLSRATRLVLDADALNAVAADPALQNLLNARGARGFSTVLTPHPLEAARLAGVPDAAAIQADRLRHAQDLAERWGCVVLIKGSGSVIAAPGQRPYINGSGNARLASAGTGDVLAGWLGGLWSAFAAYETQAGLQNLVQAACWLHGAAAEPAAAQHGEAASAQPLRHTLSASELIERLSL